MKKLLSLLLAICCLTALVACDAANQDKDQDDTDAKTTQAETGVSDDTSAATEIETEIETETDAATEAETQSTVTAPAGYTLFENDALSFAYPKGWAKQDGSVVILQDAVTGNNITVVSESKNAFYDTMTIQDFEAQMKPVYEAMGMTVENVKLERKENAQGLKVLMISYDNTTQGMSMKQTQYVTTIGAYSYTVTVTEVAADAELAQTVFDTLAAK